MENGFFKWVWRFNAILICVGALLVVCLILWETTRNLRKQVFPTATRDTLVLADEDTAEAQVSEPHTLRFAAPNQRTASGLYALPLYAEQNYPNRGISKGSSGNLLNYLIVDANAESRRWLLPDASRLIIDTRQLTHRQNGTETHLGHILSVVTKDTNGDGRLSRKDTRTIFFTDAQWNKPIEMTDGVTAILATEAVSPEAFDLIIMKQDDTHVMRLTAPTAMILSQQSFSPRQ